jgi:hypothetical protein
VKARRPLILACALVALFALPAYAKAKAGYDVRPAGTEMFIDLGERGGFDVVLEANDRQRVLLTVEDTIFSVTEYSTEGRLSSQRIEADFGELGKIDIEIRLKPRQSYTFPPPRNCKGPATIEVPGTFSGSIKFSGEGDIPPFSVERGEAEFVRRFKRVCKQPQPRQNGKKKRKPKLDVGLLEVLGKAQGRTSFLGAVNFALREKPRVSFGLLVAGAFRRSEGVLIESSTLAFFDRESFKVSERGKSPARVSISNLLEPFAGRARYLHKPGLPPIWTGNLIVDLPGNRIPLAKLESDLEVRFCRGASEAEAHERCIQGSGSHSRPLALARLSSLAAQDAPLP